MKSIFVQISSYQDYELSKTILDCINKSSGEYNIYFGISLVTTKDDIDIPDIPNLKVSKSLAPLNLGVGIGRTIANSFYDGEDYYLQIDSHTRFVKDWDKKVIKSYTTYLESGYNPVLTVYPARYWYEDNKEILDENLTLTSIEFKTEDKELFNRAKFYHQTAVPANDNIFTKSISGGSVFSSGTIAKITPNKKMYNWGEEMLHAIRLFTHGYDLMIPQEQYLYHLYYNHDTPDLNYRSLAVVDFPNEVARIVQESDAEMSRIITNQIIGEQELGDSRSLKDYAFYADISLD